MKKKLIVLLMASSMALAACTSEPAVAPTTEATTEAVTEATETSEEVESSDEAESSEEVESSDEAESTEEVAGADVNADLSALASMDFKSSLELTGITLEEADGGYVMTYPAAMFAGLSEDEIKAAIAADDTGVVTLNDDGSVAMSVTADQFAEMEAAYNDTMSSLAQ